ncbi:hypothetical protein SERLA73DRAFT_182797, partial [Serpula lacrymans var. lacrymans S7.3]
MSDPSSSDTVSRPRRRSWMLRYNSPRDTALDNDLPSPLEGKELSFTPSTSSTSLARSDSLSRPTTPRRFSTSSVGHLLTPSTSTAYQSPQLDQQASQLILNALD